MKKKPLLSLLAAALLLLSAPSGAEVVKLPEDFSPGLRPQGQYPAPFSAETWNRYEDPSITAEYESFSSSEHHTSFFIT